MSHDKHSNSGKRAEWKNIAKEEAAIAITDIEAENWSWADVPELPKDHLLSPFNPHTEWARKMVEEQDNKFIEKLLNDRYL